MRRIGGTDPASDAGAASDPPELLEVQAEAQRLLAARAALEACETDLVRVASIAMASGLSTEHICDRLGELGMAPGQLPAALRTTLGYSGRAE